MRKYSEKLLQGDWVPGNKDLDYPKSVVQTPDSSNGLAEARAKRLGGLASRMTLRELLLEQSLREKTTQLQELLTKFGQNIELSKRVEELESERRELMDRLQDLACTLSKTEEVELALRGELDRMDKEIEGERQYANEEIIRLEEELSHVQDILLQEKQASFDYLNQVQESENRLCLLTEEFSTKLRDSKLIINDRETLIGELEATVSHFRQELSSANVELKRFAEQNERLKFEKAKLERQVDEIQSDRMTLSHERNRYCAESEQFTQELLDLRTENQDLKEELKNVINGYEEYLSTLQADHNQTVEELETKNRILSSRLDGMREHQARSVHGAEVGKGHTPANSQNFPNFLIEDMAAADKDDDSDIDRSVGRGSLTNRYHHLRRQDGRIKAWEYGDRLQKDTQSVDNRDGPKTLTRVPTPKKNLLSLARNGNDAGLQLPALKSQDKSEYRIYGGDDLSVDRYGLPRLDKTPPTKNPLAIELRKIFKSATDLQAVTLQTLVIEGSSCTSSRGGSSSSFGSTKAVFPPKPGKGMNQTSGPLAAGQKHPSGAQKQTDWGVFDFQPKTTSFFKMFSIPQFLNLAMYVTFL